MRTNFDPIVEEYLKKFNIDTNSAIQLMIDELSKKGHTLPFSTPDEYRAYSVEAAAENNKERDRIIEESKFIDSLRYKKNTPRYYQELFRNNFQSLNRESGYSAEQSFEKSNAYTPGVFKSLQEYENYVKSLRGFTPELISKGLLKY
jgi:hypothetical protein